MGDIRERSNILETWQLTAKEIKRKRMVARAIARVEHEETSADDNDGMKEKCDLEMTPWTMYAITIFPEFYKY